MSTQVNARGFTELATTLQELETLSSKAGPFTKKDECRHAELLAKVSLLKSGVSPLEIREFEKQRLLQAAGLPRAPERARGRDEDNENLLRRFLRGEEVPATYRPKDSETRVYDGQLAGTQSILHTQEAPGGTLVFPEMNANLYEAMKQGDDIFSPEFSNVVETPNGAVMSTPIWDDTNSDAVQVGEGSQSLEVTIAPGVSSKQLAAYAFRSQIVAISSELANDMNWPVYDVLEKIHAARLARGVGKALILGSGVSQPEGLLGGVIGAGAPIVVANGSAANDGNGANTGANSIGTRDIIVLFKALNAKYRRNAKFFMNDSTLSALLSLIDKIGHPIRMVDTTFEYEAGKLKPCYYILGRKVAICNSMS